MFDIKLTNARGHYSGWIDGAWPSEAAAVSAVLAHPNRVWYAHIRKNGVPVGSIWPGSAKVRRPS